MQYNGFGTKVGGPDEGGDRVSEPTKQEGNMIVTLPLHLKWSGPRTYDLSDLQQRQYVYEVVLREGGEKDIRRFIDPDELLAMWDDLVIPPHVRTAWANWFRFTHGVDVAGHAARGDASDDARNDVADGASDDAGDDGKRG